MADLHLPTTLTPLYPGLSRHQEIDAATVDDALTCLDDSYPGLRDRLCHPRTTLRPHIHVYVDGQRAALDTPVASGSRIDVIAAISGG
jgi:sulfur-carrier protein